jgi:sulfite reductase (ferredoxin)
VHPQKDGRSYVGFAPRAGRVYGHQLRIVADLAEKYGSGRIRTTTQQKMVIVDVAPENVEALSDALADEDLRVDTSAFRRGMMACTGIEFCKLAIVETKARAQWLYAELDERIPDWDQEIRINVNGCPNSCARFQVADIGLMGASLPRPDGTKSDGFLVNMGGRLGADRAVGRRVKGLRVFAEDIADYIEHVLRLYKHRDTEGNFDSFGSFVNSLSDQELAAFAAQPPKS